jgi:Ser/Thr protein kinase RdoA (MazF antagonist)
VQILNQEDPEPRGNTLDNLPAVAGQFAPQGTVIDVRELGNGNINSTFLVTLDTEVDTKGAKQFVLQRINTRVFLHPQLVMRNMRISTEHILKRLRRAPLQAGRRWEVPRPLSAKDGSDLWLDPEGETWRAVSYIGGSRSFAAIKDRSHAEEVGFALGTFHALLSDLPPARLADTLEGFHSTPGYLRHYEEVIAKYRGNKSPEVVYCVQYVAARSAWAHVLEDARAQGKLFLRPIHGDPKVDNIMMDKASGRAIGIVDLDTVKPGLVHYDIGDCFRSACNPQGEETDQWEDVRFDTDIFRAVLRGYLSSARNFFTSNDFHYLYDAVRLLAFELGLRFFTDFLEGDVYFRVRRPEHNLRRALVQFRLAASIESLERAIRSIIGEIG